MNEADAREKYRAKEILICISFINVIKRVFNNTFSPCAQASRVYVIGLGVRSILCVSVCVAKKYKLAN